ncbi:HAD family hydrolase [Actinoplanes campanulatus]|nr:HAD-IA family hydrolase [Actinoplanes capillaceus]
MKLAGPQQPPAGHRSEKTSSAGPDGCDRLVDAIICDVGNVLIEFSARRSAEIEQLHGLGDGELFTATLKTSAARLAMSGAISHDEWHRQTAAIIGDAAVADWLADHGELNRPVVEILETARAGGIRVLLLSNATTRLWADLDHHGIRNLADQVFCSAEIGYAKPDPRAYRFVLEAAAIDAGRALYVDDTASWVEAGRRASGLHGYVYGTPSGLRHELAALGVTV